MAQHQGGLARYKKVTLYEDNAGGLYINLDGEDIAYCVSGDPGQFVNDALALAQGKTGDWTCETVPVVDMIERGAQIVDEWPGSIPYSDTDLAAPGRAAREYIGLVD